MRIAGVRNEERGIYHRYATNLSPREADAEEIGRLYGARRVIELDIFFQY